MQYVIRKYTSSIPFSSQNFVAMKVGKTGKPSMDYTVDRYHNSQFSLFNSRNKFDTKIPELR